MAVADSAVLVIASQEYADAPGAHRAEHTWVVQGFSAAGWQAIGATFAELVVEFIDGRSRAAGAASYPQIEGIAQAAALPVAAAVRIPIQLLRFRRGTAVCSAEVADILEPLARAWCTQVTKPASAMVSIDSVGVGRSDEKGALLDTGTLLIRFSAWEDDGSLGALRREARRLTAAHDEILAALAVSGSG